MERLIALFRLSEDTNPQRINYRYLPWIALNSGIDSSLFLSCGKALAAGGPGSLLLTESLSCIMLFCAVGSLSEMTLYQPSGSFIAFAFRYTDPAWAFAVGWMYIFHSFLMIPLGIIGAAKMVKSFLPSFNMAMWIGIFLLPIFGALIVETKRLAQLMALITIAKILILSGLGLLGIFVAATRQSFQGPEAFAYWKTPGAFNSGLFGTAAVLFFSGTNPSGLDLISLATRESNQMPGKFPAAIRAFFWILSTIRIFSAVIAGVEAPFTDLRLLDSTTDFDVTVAPIGISIVDYGVPHVGVIFLKIICVLAQLSTSFSAIFGASRAIVALALQGQAPDVLVLRDRQGRPLISIWIAALLAVCGFIALSDFPDLLLIYIVSLGGIPVLFVHLTIFVAHIRFHSGLQIQGRSISGIMFKCSIGQVGSWFGIIFNLGVIASQLWTGLARTGYSEALSVGLVGSEFVSYVYIIISLGLYTSYKLWYRSRWRKAAEMDFSIH